jgi:hypothetical protein
MSSLNNSDKFGQHLLALSGQSEFFKEKPSNLVSDLSAEKLKRNTIKSLLVSLLEADPRTIEEKVTILHLLTDLCEDIEEKLENQHNVLHWTAIASAFASAGTLAGLAILNPLAGVLVAAVSGTSAAATVVASLLQNQESSIVIDKVKRLKLTLKSRDLIDWACIWGLVGADLFCDSLAVAGKGEITDYSIEKRGGITPFTAAVRAIASARGISADSTVAYLKEIHSGTRPHLENIVKVAAKELTSFTQKEIVQSDLPNNIPADLFANALAIRDSLVNRAADSVLGGCVILAAPGAGKTTFLGTAWGKLKEAHGSKFKSLAVVVKKSDVDAFKGVSDNCLCVKSGAVTAAIAIIKFVDGSTSHTGNVSRLFLDDFLTMQKYFETALKGKFIDPETCAVFDSRKEATEYTPDSLPLHDHLLTLLNEYWLVGREYNSAVWVSSHSSNVKDLPFMGSASARSVGDMIFLAKNGKREFIEFALDNGSLIGDSEKRQSIKTQLDSIDVASDEPLVLANFNNWTLGIVPNSVYKEYQSYRKQWEANATTNLEAASTSKIETLPTPKNVPMFLSEVSPKHIEEFELEEEEEDNESPLVETIEDIGHAKRFLETLAAKEPLTDEAQKIYTKIYKNNSGMTIRELVQSKPFGKKGNNTTKAVVFYLGELTIGGYVVEDKGFYRVA